MDSQIPNPEAPNPQLPVVQRLRVRYAKRGRLRFTSHRDFARAFERAVRRAQIPIGFSSGFSPHPKISYANAAPTGSASEAEFLEIGLTESREPSEVLRALDEALPPGLDILDIIVADAAGSLADRLEASTWRIDLAGADPDQVVSAVAAFLAAEDVSVDRMMKRGMRAIDVRGAVVDLTAEGSTVSAVVRSTVPTVRPDDIVTGLRAHGLEYAGSPVAQRLSQGPLRATDGGAAVGDPLRE
jgi:radical SAM-linked protein